MKNISIFVSDKIRMHPNEITVDGLGMAIEPFIILPLDATDEELEAAIRQCLEASKSGIPHQPWQEEETTQYFKKLDVKSQKELGPGMDMVLEEEVYTITPVDSKGLFGDPVEVGEEDMIEKIRQSLELLLSSEIVSTSKTSP